MRSKEFSGYSSRPAYARIAVEAFTTKPPGHLRSFELLVNQRKLSQGLFHLILSMARVSPLLSNFELMARFTGVYEAHLQRC